MSKLEIRREHDLSLEKAQQVADDIAVDLADKFGIDYGWDGDVLLFERPGVSGRILVDQDALHIHATLGFFLIYLKPAIEREINRYLDEHFTGAGAADS